ncbi:hypothetical protein EV561_14322 [Rhizobium sp. BK376]|nr:hypothetical protein EV561_14322 [Rhizobium sp. BK376]
MQLSDPTVFNRSLEACSHIGVKPEIQQKLAELMKVSQANVRFEFCRRIMMGYVKGTISYDDYCSLRPRLRHVRQYREGFEDRPVSFGKHA